MERSNGERCASVSDCIDWRIRTQEGTFDCKGFLVGTLQCVKKVPWCGMFTLMFCMNGNDFELRRKFPQRAVLLFPFLKGSIFKVCKILTEAMSSFGFVFIFCACIFVFVLMFLYL